MAPPPPVYAPPAGRTPSISGATAWGSALGNGAMAQDRLGVTGIIGNRVQADTNYGLGGQVQSSKPGAAHGNESRDEAMRENLGNDMKDPRFLANTLVSGGNWNQLAAIKSLGGWNKSRSAWEAFKNERARGSLMKMAGEEGMAYGYKPGSKPLASGSTWAVAQQEAKAKRNEGRVDMAYGYLPAMRNSNPYSVALNNNALIHGQVEQNVDATRDAVSADNIGNAEAGARQASFAAAEAGTTGSSMDASQKRRVLGGYLNGRVGVNSAAAGTRAASVNALEQERLGAIDKVRGRSSIDLGQRVADLSTIRQLGEAQRQVVPTAIGNSISMAGDMYANNRLYGAMINDPTRSGGASMPSLSGGTTRSTGGYRSP